MSLALLSGVASGALPAPPPRSAVLNYHTHFMGGIVVQSPVFGTMPWWDPALAWCDAYTREQVYAAKRAASDTHAMLHIPNGKPLYDEGGQFYSPDKFGALDWTNGLTRLSPQFDALLLEMLEHGFLFHLAMDEDVTNSRAIIKLVAQRLKDLGLTKYGFSMPGYDGIFYGWPIADIIGWAADARAINPDIILGIEHQPGRIPLGNGQADYIAGGQMSGYDLILGEFNMPADDTVWQVLGRMVRPYNRPPDQPAGDDPNPPYYLIDWPARGPYGYVAFETDNPYHWVRVDMADPNAVQAAISQIESERQYLTRCGAVCTG